MEGMRSYTTAIVVSFLLVALSVLGLRWHALTQRVVTPAQASTLYSYAPPQGRSGNSAGRSTAPNSATNKSRGVSPSKAPTKTAPPVQEAEHKSAYKSKAGGLPKLHSININTATQAQLEALPGIGPALASRIISHRNEHGRFRNVDALDEVKGIGPKKLADIAPYCFVD